MSRNEIMYLQDIAQSCEKVLRYTQSLSQTDLVREEKTYDAVVRNLEIIGEAAKHISDELRKQLPNIEWRKVAGLRDMLAHDILVLIMISFGTWYKIKCPIWPNQ